MDGLAMLREIIAQLRHLFELRASSPDLHLLHLHQPENLYQILDLPPHQPLIIHPHLATTRTRTCVSSAMGATRGGCGCSSRTNNQLTQQPAAVTFSSSSSSSSMESAPPSSSSTSSSSTPSKKQRSSETRTTTSIMKEEIWKHLPEDLIQKVKSHLPLAALFRARLVSHKWNSMEFSPHLLHQEKWVYAVTQGPQGWLYEPSSKKWRPRTIPDLKTLIPVASSSGLVCSLSTEDNGLYVCNPLTGTARRINRRGSWSGAAFGMWSLKKEEGEEGEEGEYGVVWVGSDGGYGVYESGRRGGREGRVGGSVRRPLWVSMRRAGSARVGGEVYFLRTGPEGVVAYNVERGGWREYVIPAPANVTDRALGVKGGGEEEGLVLVGLQKKKAATCVCVWELQRMCFLWKEVDRMPNLWCLDFYGKDVRMVCVANSRLILLSLTSGSTHRLVSYDTGAAVWAQLSSSPSLFASGAAFRPSPTALP